MYQLILLHSCAYLQKTSIKINVATNEDKQPKSNVTLNKRWNWNRCTKFALSVSWTHGLIAQLVRASERNSMVVGSNPTQTNFLELLQQIFQWWTPYIYQFIPLHSCDYLNKIAIKINVATYEGNSQNEIWRWTNDEIGIAVTNWLWVLVELMAW